MATFTDTTIQESIENNAAETTTGEVRDVLDAFQRSFEALWNEHMDAVEDNALEVVSVDFDVIVLADHSGQFWNDEFKQGPLGETDSAPRMQTVVTQLHHKWARQHTDHNWDQDEPVVVKKPESFNAGQRLVEAVMLNFTNRGLTPAQAWSVWGVMAGNSRNNWATRMGYDSHSGVSNPIREAKDKLPLGYI